MEASKNKGNCNPRYKGLIALLASVDPPSYVGELISYLAILLTFGAVFPPLALVICLAIFVDTFFAQQRMLASNVIVPTNQDQLLGSNHRIPIFNFANLSILCPFAAIFYSMFLVDILGDEAGITNHIYWAPTVMILMSLLFLLLIFYLSMAVSKYSTKKNSFPAPGSVTPVDVMIQISTGKV